MYHPKIISRNLNLIQQDLPFDLQYHSFAYIRSATSHLESLINMTLWKEKGKLVLSRPLAPDEQQFIRNEQILCTYDYLHLATNYAKILHWNFKGVDYFTPSKAQLIMNDVRAEMELNGIGIWMLQLKTRQVGASTDDQIAAAHRLVFHENTRGLTASSKEDKTRQLANKAGLVIKELPYFLLPTKDIIDQNGNKIGLEADFKIFDSGEVFFESGKMNCQMRLQWGTQEGGVGRGETPDFFHGTEIPDWANPKEDIQNSLLKSMHNDPRMFFAIESTGKYIGDYYNDLWEDSVQYYFKGQSRFYPLFLGWYVADDIYPTKTDVRAFMPSDYKPSERVEMIAAKAQRYVSSNTLLRKHLGADWQMTIEQKWFYEWDRQQAEREKRLATWLCEMPSTPEEAFAVRGSGMFDAEFIESLREKAQQPEFVFGIRDEKNRISYRNQFYSAEIDSSLPVLPVEFKWSSNPLYQNSYKLHPLSLRNYSPLAMAGLFIVWELPEENEEYEIGVDCGEGVGQDYTCIYVLRKGDYLAGTVDKVVAAFYSNTISASELQPFLECVSSFYSVIQGTRLVQCKLVIERPKGGAALIQEMLKAGWKNFFTNRNLAVRQYKDPSEQLGWEPNQQQRDALLSEYLRAIRDLEIEIPCQFIINQLATFGWNITRRKIEALAGHHDDAILSSGMAYFSMNSFHLKGKGETAEKRRLMKQLALQKQAQRFIYSEGDRALPVPAKNTFSYWNRN